MRGSTTPTTVSKAMFPDGTRLGRMRAVLFLLLGALLLAPGLASAQEPRREDGPFRLAFMASMFAEVSENDARAAMTVWISTIATRRGVPVDADIRIHHTVDEAAADMLARGVDGIGLTALEYAELRERFRFNRLAVGRERGTITDEYVLLVRGDRGITDLRQLAGGSLIVLRSPRTDLAAVWLDTLLLQNGLEPAARFFRQVTKQSKTSRVALPVFFGQADACVMTRKRFRTLEELNPQLGRQLRVLSTSPEYVPSGFAFRADFVSPFREQILTEMARLSESPAGQQILTLTQAEHIEASPLAVFQSALDLIDAHRRLSSRRKGRSTAERDSRVPVGYEAARGPAPAPATLIK